MKVFSIVILIVNLIGLWFSFTGSTTTVIDSPLRIVCAGLIVTILPGMMLGQYLGIRGQHYLGSIAWSSVLSLIVSALSALVFFIFKVSILWWALFIIFWNLFWALVVILRKPDRPGLIDDIIASFRGRDRLSNAMLLVILIGLSAALYRWADDISGLEWEVALHQFYVRQYASGLPLDFTLSLLRPDIKLPNFFFLWEFILAGISQIAGIDSLIAALRSRWLIPLLGFSSFFFMTLNLTGSAGTAKRTVWIIVVASMAGFLLLDPSPFIQAGIIDSPYRGITAFWGSLHHSDTAMEILLPLQIGLLFLYIRTGGIYRLSLLCGILLAGFFWHPREYFQVMWYGVISFIAYLLLYFEADRKVVLKRYVHLTAAFLLIALSLALLTKTLSGDVNETQAQLASKNEYVKMLFNPETLSIKLPFDFGMHGLISVDNNRQPPVYIAVPTQHPPYIFSWMAFASLLLIPLLVSGRRTDVFLSGFVLILWCTTLCFVWTQALLIVLTYAEILISTPRFVYLFMYVILGVGWFNLIAVMGRSLRRFYPDMSSLKEISVLFLFCFALGMAFWFTWNHEAPKFTWFKPLLNIVVAACAFGIISILNPMVPFHDRLAGFRSKTAAATSVNLMTGVLTFIVFLAPACHLSFQRFLHNMITNRINVCSLFKSDNPTGVSEEMISFLRGDVPPRSRILIDSQANRMLGIYAPLYLLPIPGGNVHADAAIQKDLREDRHPIFNRKSLNGIIDADEVYEYATRHHADYIMAGTDYSRSMKYLVHGDGKERFRIAFKSSNGKEMLVKVVK